MPAPPRWATPRNPLHQMTLANQLQSEDPVLAGALLRVEVLEHLVAEQSAQFARLEQRHEKLREDYIVLQEDHLALCDCLRTAGRLCERQPQDRRCIRKKVALLQEVLEVPELLFKLGSAVGVASARVLPAVSRAHGVGMRMTLPTLKAKVPPCIHVFGGHTVLGTPLATAERYDPRFHHWEVLAPMSSVRFSNASATVGNRIYVVGGNDGQQVLDTMESFDPTSNRWEKMPRMPTARQRCAAAGIAGRLYVVGGERQEPLRACERFEPSTRRWTVLPPMLLDRSGCAAASLQDRLYVAGGADSAGHASASVEVLDPAIGAWVQLPHMNHAREFCAAAAMGGRLYVLGGRLSLWSTLGTVECFDPAVGAWIAHPDMPEERSRCATAVSGGAIYVVGGSDSRYEALDTAVCYDPQALQWWTLPPAPTARVSCAMAAAWS